VHEYHCRHDHLAGILASDITDEHYSQKACAAMNLAHVKPTQGSALAHAYTRQRTSARTHTLVRTHAHTLATHAGELHIFLGIVL